jgi:multimeric flavodoxin WrbA
MASTIKVLGISGSPRHGNTEAMIEEALSAARELPGVETELFSLAGKRIHFCQGCYRCARDEATPDNPCPAHNDDAVLLTKKVVACDAVIVGTPVYIGTVTAQLKAFLDRSIMMTEMGALGPLGMRNKVCGAVVCAADRLGGHEMAIVDIWRWALLADMPVIAVGPERMDCVSYWAACASQGGHGDAKEEPFEVYGTPEELSAVTKDTSGMNACRQLGYRVAELAKVIKTGFETLPREETRWPRGPAGGFQAPDGTPLYTF